MKILFLVIFVVTFSVGLAVADECPLYDVRQHCMFEFGGSGVGDGW